MQEITPEQKEQLKTWAGQRDALLSEISALRDEKEGLEQKNREVADSNTEITASINKVIGRIEELEKKEKDLVTRQLIELSRIQVEKAGVESDIENLSKIVGILNSQKKNIEDDIVSLTDVFKKIDGQVSDLNKIVDHVTRVSSDNVVVFDTLMANLKKTLGELIDVNTKNVFETNVVIEKLPQMLVEARKQSLTRNKIL